MPRHRRPRLVWQLPELLKEIFSYLQDLERTEYPEEWDDLVIKPSLAACARVCRKWHEPACYWLWRDVKGTDAFYRLLAQADPNKGLDLSRFKYYSHWVQTMAHKLCDTKAQYTLQDAFVLNNAEPLFPNLKKFSLFLDYLMDGAAVLNPITFLHAGLEIVVIDDGSTTPAALQTVVECISQRSPGILELAILRVKNDVTPRRIALCHNIGKWCQLESLQLQGIWMDAELFLTIAELPRLRTYRSGVPILCSHSAPMQKS